MKDERTLSISGVREVLDSMQKFEISMLRHTLANVLRDKHQARSVDFKLGCIWFAFMARAIDWQGHEKLRAWVMSGKAVRS